MAGAWVPEELPGPPPGGGAGASPPPPQAVRTEELSTSAKKDVRITVETVGALWVVRQDRGRRVKRHDRPVSRAPSQDFLRFAPPLPTGTNKGEAGQGHAPDPCSGPDTGTKTRSCRGRIRWTPRPGQPSQRPGTPQSIWATTRSSPIWRRVAMRCTTLAPTRPTMRTTPFFTTRTEKSTQVHWATPRLPREWL